MEYEPERRDEKPKWDLATIVGNSVATHKRKETEEGKKSYMKFISLGCAATVVLTLATLFGTDQLRQYNNDSADYTSRMVQGLYEMGQRTMPLVPSLEPYLTKHNDGE